LNLDWLVIDWKNIRDSLAERGVIGIYRSDPM
jgi:hypothetical protein